MGSSPPKVSFLDQLSDALFGAMGWGLLLMVLLTFVIVCLRYVFNLGWVWMQEIVLYTHAAVFLLAASAALRKDAHVRVDVFYRGFASARKAKVDFFGSLFLLLPTCTVIFLTSLPYVRDAWRVFEGSKDGGGLEAVFLLKTLIPVFAVLLFLQGLRTARLSWMTWRNPHA